MFCFVHVTLHRIVFLFIFVARNVRLQCEKLKSGPVIYFYNVNGEILVISLVFCEICYFHYYHDRFRITPVVARPMEKLKG